jgi:hypothetical protein
VKQQPPDLKNGVSNFERRSRSKNIAPAMLLLLCLAQNHYPSFSIREVIISPSLNDESSEFGGCGGRTQS